MSDIYWVNGEPRPVAGMPRNLQCLVVRAVRQERDRLAALAAGLVGLPWRAGAAGPDAFNCWGLVRYWMQAAHGVSLADVAIAVDQLGASAAGPGLMAAATGHSQLRPIRAAVRASGWRPVPAGTPAAAADVVLLRHGLTGLRHVGVLLLQCRRLHLLHCEGSTAHPWPGVVCEPYADALQRYTEPALWRHRP